MSRETGQTRGGHKCIFSRNCPAGAPLCLPPISLSVGCSAHLPFGDVVHPRWMQCVQKLFQFIPCEPTCKALDQTTGAGEGNQIRYAAK